MVNFVVLMGVLISTLTFAEEPKSTLHRQGKFELKQLVSPGFDQLPLERKLFAMELAKAIEAGHDIAWIQKSEKSLAIRNLMQGLWEHSAYFAPADKAALSEYLFLLNANHGNYDERKNKKFVPENLTFERALTMARLADKQAEGKGQAHWFEDSLKSLEKEIFDLSYKPAFHADGEGKDIISDSAANYYGLGVTKAHVDLLPQEEAEHFLSYPHIDHTGKVVLQKHRIGERFDEYLRLIDYHLKNAIQWATAEEKEILEAYREALRTGDPQDLARADGLWASHKPKDIDFVLGFVEVYGDPLNRRGEWEGFLILLNQTPEDVARVERMREKASYFEDAMPVDEKYKKKGKFTPPKAEGAYLLYSGGANGERPFAGVNLPNTTIDPKIHEKYGSKSYTADNVMADIGETPKEFSPEQMAAFYAPEYHELLKRVDKKLERSIQVEFHEILGHGSGKVEEGVKDTDLGQYYSAVEEGRAEVASLYHMLDDAIRKFDIVPSTWSDQQLKDFQTATIIVFFTSHLRTYERLADDAVAIRQAHQWGRQVMMSRLVKAGAFEIDNSVAAAPVIRNVDLAKARKALGDLWAVIQEMKSTGDLESAKKVFESDGAYADYHRELRKRIVQVVEDLSLPTEKAYMNPDFHVVTDASGKPTDVKLVYGNAESAHLERFVDRQVKRAKDVQNALSCSSVLKK